MKYNKLLINTTDSLAQVALLGEDNKDTKLKTSELKHSKILIPMIEDILKENDTKVENIKLIGVCVGPGSFTGIRIGIAAAKGIAFLKDIKILPVTTLELISFSGLEFYNIKNTKNLDNKLIVSTIYAKNNQIYYSLTDKNKHKENSGSYIELFEDLENYIKDNIKNELKYNEILFLGDGINDQFDEEFNKSNLKKFLENKDILINKISTKENEKYIKPNILNIIYKMNEKNYITEDKLLPNYLKKTQAQRELNKKLK